MLGPLTCDLRALVASGRREAGRRADQTAVEEGVESAGEDGAPFLRSRQLLRTFRQTSQEVGDGGERSGRRLGFGVRARHSDRRLSRMPRTCGDGRQEQGPAGDRLAMGGGVGQTNEDVPPIKEQRNEPRRQPTTRQIVGREAAPTPWFFVSSKMFSSSPRSR